MGYSKNLVERLRNDGVWDQLTGDQQRRFQGLTDEQARQILVLDDHWEMGERSAVEVFGLVSFVRMTKAFRGALVQRAGSDSGKLSSAGRSLAEFFCELQKRGMTADEIDEGMRDLGPLVIAAVMAAHQGSSE